MAKQFSKNESKYRKKLIAEYQLNRNWQLKMDYWAFCLEYYFCSIPYKKMYQKCKLFEQMPLKYVRIKFINDFKSNRSEDWLEQGEYAAINFIFKNKVRDWQRSAVIGDDNYDDK